MFLQLTAVFIGGGLGALARYALFLLAVNYSFKAILATFLANIVGCFFIGVFLGVTLYKSNFFTPTARLFLMTGILGGLTTFSTFNLEIFELIRGGKIFSGLIYLILSCSIGLFATFLGYWIFVKLFLFLSKIL